MAIDPRMRELAAYIDKMVKREVGRAMSQPQLAHSSIEDGSLDAYDGEGTQTMQVGRQFDGTHTSASLAGPPPPTPVAPILTPVTGGLVVEWAGGFEDDAVAPMDYARVEVQASTSPDFDPLTAGPPEAVYPSARGGKVYVALPPVEQHVALVCRSQSGKPSGGSVQATATPLEAPNLDDIFPITETDIAPDAITSPLIAANAVQALHLAAELILTSLLQAGEIDPETGEWVGGRWEGDSSGIRIYGPDGELQANLTTESLVSIRGDLVATAMTVLDHFALRGRTNEVSKSSRLVLATGTTAPTSPPSVEIGYATKPIHEGFSPRGFATDGASFFTAEELFGAAVTRTEETAEQFAWAGNSSDFPSSLQNAYGGVACLGNSLYVLGSVSDDEVSWGVGHYYVHRLDRVDNEWTYATRWRYYPDSALGGGSRYHPAIGVKGSNLIIAQCGDVSGAPWVSEYTTGGAFVRRDNLMNADGSTWRPSAHSRAILYGSFDIGSPRYVLVIAGQARATMFDATTHRHTPADNFPLPSTQIAGMLWDGTRFRSRTASTVHDHTDLYWTDPDLDQWNVGYSWHDPDPAGDGEHETQQGVAATFAMKKRARVRLQTSPIPPRSVPPSPDDATAVRFYLTRTGSPADRLATLSPGETTLVVDTYPEPRTVPLAPPPAFNDFPAAAPAEIASDDGSLVLRGNGEMEVYGSPAPRVDADTVTVNVPSGTSTGTASVTFEPGRFTAPPVVTANAVGTSIYFAYAANVTATGCDIGIREYRAQQGPDSRQVNWTAVQVD